MEKLVILNEKTSLSTTFFPHPTGETIFLLHGGPGVPDDLCEVVELLKGSFQIVSFHQRGTGLSPCGNEDYSMESYLSDIDAIASYLHLPKFHLFGHSWGGLYAQLYAECHPEKTLSLFLCSPSSGTGGHWKKTEMEILSYHASKSTIFEFLAMGWHSLLGMLGLDSSYQALFHQVIHNYTKGYIGPKAQTFFSQHIRASSINKTRKELLRHPLLKNWTHPNFNITVTYGEDDIYGDSKKYVRERYPTGMFHQIELSSHFPWFQNPNAFIKVLQTHFKFQH